MDIIRVRGKNKRRPEKPQPGRLRGRPMKPFRELASVTKPKRQRFYSVRKVRSRDSLAELERLPAELIEQIFFYAEELNLPRTSPHLGRKLSSESVYRKTIIRAFGGRNGLKIPSSDEQKELQCAVLRTKWCRVSTIMNALPLIARRALQEGWWDCPIYNEIELLPAEQDLWLEHAEASVANTKEHFWQRCNMSPLRFVCGCGASPEMIREFPVFRVLTIPDFIMRQSPESTESLFTLQLLRHGWRYGCPKYDIPPLNPESIHEAMERAINNGNVQALLTLAELAAVSHLRLVYRPPDLERDFQGNFDASLIPSKLFQRATQQPQALKLLQILVRLNLQSLPKDDPILTSWAISATKRTNNAEFARWLLELMEHSFMYQQESMFIYGRPKSWFVPNIPYSLRDADYFDVECGYNLSVFRFDDARRYSWED